MRAIERNVPSSYVSARRFGANWKDCEMALGKGSDLAYYLMEKEAKRNKKAKVYEGCVYIFFSTSDRCITCYRIPERYSEEYEKIRWMEKKRKDDFRKEHKNRT